MFPINTVKVWHLYFLTFNLIHTVQEFLVQDKARAATGVCQPSRLCTHWSSSLSRPANKLTKPNTYRGIFLFSSQKHCWFWLSDVGIYRILYKETSNVNCKSQQVLNSDSVYLDSKNGLGNWRQNPSLIFLFLNFYQKFTAKEILHTSSVSQTESLQEATKHTQKTIKV